MPTPVKPDRFARAAGFDPEDFVNAVQSGASEYNGLPIASWRQDGGAFLNIPDDYAQQLGIGRERDDHERRPNPPEKYPFGMYGQRMPPPTGWPDALREAAPPVSANAGAAYTMGKFADTVAQQPQVMEDVVDGVALLGSAGLAYATAKEGDVVRAGLTTIGLFGAFKLFRYACRQKDDPTGMQGRKRMRQRPVRHQQEQLQATDQKRLGGRAHRSATTLDR